MALQKPAQFDQSLWQNSPESQTNFKVSDHPGLHSHLTSDNNTVNQRACLSLLVYITIMYHDTPVIMSLYY